MSTKTSLCCSDLCSCASTAMSFNELSRRELQTMCKEYGLPANKSNAAMASSLTTFLGVRDLFEL